MLAFTEDSTLIRNTITSGGLGMWNCSNNVISHNDIMHSISGLCLQYSRQNAVCGNNFTNCEYALLIDLSANNSIFENNIVASNDSGIRLLQSSNNSIVGNNIANNRYGIHLVESSSNEFYHNNFINNTYQVYSYDSLNVWDDGYPSGGNYWSDYTERYPDAEEIGDSGLWDTPYVIDENNQDNYPLINPWTPPPNLPPVALFDYYPVEPKAGEQVMFNATSSYDPDGEILFYAWDWNGDGYFDEYTISPIVIFWWEEEGSYNVTLVTVDDDGATSEDSIKKEIVISESYESKIILAGWGCNPIWTALHWKDHCNFKEIDDWLRESSDRLSWLPSKFIKLEEPDIVDVLNTEIDHDLAPDVTYMDYAISMIYEAELVDEAWRQPTAKLNIMMAPLVEYVFNSIWDLFVSEQQIVELATKVSLTAGLTLAIGLPTMQMAKKIFDLKTLVDLALKEGYTLGLGRYFYNRWLYGNHEDAWNDPDVQNAVCLSISYDATEEQKNQILQETSWYFDSLWMEYYADDFYDPFVVHATGLPQDLENLIKADLKNLIISALEDNPEVLKDSIITNIASPVELYISDSQGRITGVVRGEVREEIPFSVYDWETETIRIFNTSDLYDYRTVGVSASTYKLEVTSIENGTILSFIANEIPTWLAATHQYTVDWTALFHGQEGVSVKVDSEGDGSFEYNFTSDNELTRIEYVAATTGHDLDVTRVASPKSVVGEGYTIPVNVTIMNYGVYTETFNITLYANITLVASQIVAVANASSITITFMWNTNGFAKGNYTLSAIAEQVPGETYTADNTLVDGSIRVTISGDVDGDFDVDIFDVVKITSIYASKQGDPRFSPNSDIDGDGVITIFDVVICTSHYGQKYP